MCWDTGHAISRMQNCNLKKYCVSSMIKVDLYSSPTGPAANGWHWACSTTWEGVTTSVDSAWHHRFSPTSDCSPTRFQQLLWRAPRAIIFELLPRARSRLSSLNWLLPSQRLPPDKDYLQVFCFFVAHSDRSRWIINFMGFYVSIARYHATTLRTIDFKCSISF